jgi:[ribosomal protein S5]-alanine N-acetyltransferase
MSIDASTRGLETDRLLLRPLCPDDLDSLAAIQADPEVMRYFPSGSRSIEQTRIDLERCILIQAEYGFSLWATIERESGLLIGRSGLLPQTLQDRREVELAYMIARSHWGRGLATEAARAILDHGFRTLGLDRLVSIIHRDNLASRRVAENAGLKPERMIQFMNHRCWLYAIESKDRGKT